MPQYGNAATILNFPDYYASNRIAEPKVLSGGISTGNWGKGAGLPGSRTGGQATPENTAFLKGYNLDAVPEGLQQEADATREVLQAYSDLRSVYVGFRKKGIDLAAIDPANPMQVEAATIYRNLASDYLFKLNQVKQGAKYEELAAKTQAGNANVTPMPLDNTEVVTAADVAIATPATISRPVEMWNAEARTPPKSQAEYDTRIADYKRIMAGIDDQVRYAMIDGRTAAQWKANMLPPTPFTAEPIDPLADKFLDGAITNWNTETNQPPKTQAEYDTRMEEYNMMVDNVGRVGGLRGYNQDQVSAWKARLRKPTPFTPDLLEEEKTREEIKRIKASTFAANAGAALALARKKDIEANGVGGSNAPVNALYRDAGGFINFAKEQIKNDPSYLAAVPMLDIADGTRVKVSSIIDANNNAKYPQYDLTHFGQAMSIPKSAGNGSITNILLRTGKNGEPVYYVVEESSVPEANADGKIVQEPAYTFRKITNANNVIKSGSLAGYPTELQTLATGAKSVQQVNGNEQYGGNEDMNFMGQESGQATNALPVLNFNNFAGAPGRTVKR